MVCYTQRQLRDPAMENPGGIIITWQEIGVVLTGIGLIFTMGQAIASRIYTLTIKNFHAEVRAQLLGIEKDFTAKENPVNRALYALEIRAAQLEKDLAEATIYEKSTRHTFITKTMQPFINLVDENHQKIIALELKVDRLERPRGGD